MSIFSSTGVDNKNYSNLLIQDIFELLYLWSMKIQRFQVIEMTKLSGKTITSWFSHFRKICQDIFKKRKPMGGGLKKVIEIDESLIRGKRKNHRGRFLNFDTWRADPNAEYFEINESDEDDISITEESVDQYNNRIDGPWVLGIVECEIDDNGKRKMLETRYFWVEKRDKNTLLPIILNEVEKGAIIYTDEWKAYNSLNTLGYVHKTVNHSQYYVSSDGNHTNTVEVTWHHLKTRILRKMFGIPNSLLTSYLIEESVRSKHQNGFQFLNIFIEFLSNNY